MNIFLFKQDVLRIVTSKVMAKRGRTGQQAARRGGGGDGRGGAEGNGLGMAEGRATD